MDQYMYSLQLECVDDDENATIFKKIIADYANYIGNS